MSLSRVFVLEKVMSVVHFPRKNTAPPPEKKKSKIEKKSRKAITSKSGTTIQPGGIPPASISRPPAQPTK
jgi:hypothetical protein